MNTLDTYYQKVNLVTVTTILEEISIKFSPGYLMNREKLGIPLRKAIVGILHSMEDETLVINMAGIEEMTTSVAEEIGPVLFQEFIKYRIAHENVYLTYCNVSEEMARGLDGTFKNSTFGYQTNEKQNIVV